MRHYFLTNGIYNESNLIAVEVQYTKGKGYGVVAFPCHKGDGWFGKVFSGDYYAYYYDIVVDVVQCSRRNVSKEKIANDWMEEHLQEVVDNYCEYCLARGGRNIEVIKEIQ